jgi:uncharacterized protein YktA (UPF0223 family)
MQRKSNIKWRDNDVQKLNRIVKNFNAKIDRLLKKNNDLKDVLPQKIDKKSLAEKIETRQDFNREMNSLQRFSKRGSEKIVSNKQGVTTTKWQKSEIGRKVAVINAQRTKLRNVALKDGTKKGTMGSVKTNNLNPKPFNFKDMEKRDWNKFVESVEKQIQSTYSQAKAEAYKVAYLNAIDEHLGEHGAMLKKVLSQVDAKILYTDYYEDYLMQINFTSDDLPAEDIAESALERWKERLYDTYNLDVDGNGNLIDMNEEEESEETEGE